MIFGPTTSTIVYAGTLPGDMSFEFSLEADAITMTNISFSNVSGPVDSSLLQPNDTVNIFMEGELSSTKVVAFKEGYVVNATVNTVNFTTPQAIQVTVMDSASDDLVINSITIVKNENKYTFDANGLANFDLINVNPDFLIVNASDATYKYSFFRDLTNSPVQDGLVLDKASFNYQIQKDHYNNQNTYKFSDIAAIGSNNLYLFKVSTLSGDVPVDLNYELGTPINRSGTLTLDGSDMTNIVAPDDRGIANLRVYGDILGGVDINKDVELNVGNGSVINPLISYNDVEGYFSLTTQTTNGSAFNNIHISINQVLLEGFLVDNIHIQNPDVRLVQMDNGNPIDMPLDPNELHVDFKNQTNPNDSKFDLNVRTQNSVTLLDNTEYRIYIGSPFAKNLLASIKDNVYLYDTETVNLRGNMDDMIDNQSVNHLEFGNIYLNTAVTSSSLATVKQFGGNQTLYSSDSQVKFDVNTSDHVDHLIYLIESNTTLALPNINIKVGNTEFSDIAPVQTVLGNLHTYKYEVLVDADFTSPVTVFLTPSGNAQNFIQTLTSKLGQGTYVLNTNTSDVLVNYIELNNQSQFVTVNPVFTLAMNETTDQVNFDDSDPNNITVYGRLIVDEQGYQRVNFDLNFTDTGILNKNKLALRGTVTSQGKDDVPFYLTMNPKGSGNYGSSFNMTSTQDRFLKTVPDGFDPNQYEIMTESENYDQIPLYTAEKNHIKLYYTIDSTEYSIEFDYYPASKYDMASWVTFKSMRISGQTTEIELTADEFNLTTGASVKIIYLSGQDEVVAAKFDNQKSVETVEITDQNGQVKQVVKVVYEISDPNIGFNNITENLDGYNLLGKIATYRDYGEGYVLSGDIPISGSIFSDSQPPQFNINFEKIENIDSSDYFVFNIHLNDDVNLDELTLGKLSFKDEKDNPVTFSGMILNPNYEGMQGEQTGSISSYRLLIPATEFKNQVTITVQPLTDLVGNTSEILNQFIEIRTEVELIVRNSDFTNLDGNAAWLYPANLDPIDNDYKWPNGKEFMLFSKDEGYVKGNLPIGQYRVYAYGKQEDNDNAYPLDEIINIKPQEENTSQVIEIVLGTDNVTGHVVRTDTSMLYSDSLVVIRDDVYLDYINLEDQRDHATDQQMIDLYNQKLEAIYRAYFTNIKTEQDGTFSIYLNPDHSYKLMGRRLGNMVNELDTPIAIDLAAGSVDLTVNLPQPNLIVTVKKNDSDIMPYAEAELAIGQSKFYVQSNSDGIIPMMIEDGQTLEVKSIRRIPRKDGEDAVLFIYDTPPSFTKTAEVSTYDIVVEQPPNIIVYPSMNGEPVLVKDQFSISVNGKNIWSNGGLIKLYLENYDGGTSYAIESAQLAGNNIITTSIPIDSVNIPLDISSQVNMSIKLEDESHSPLAGRFMHININGRFYESKTNENGTAFFMIGSDALDQMTEVSIKYEGYAINNQWKNFDNMEEVVPVASFSPIYEKTIMIVGPNLKGSALDDNKSPLVKDGWLSIEKMTLPNKWFGSYIDENGYFELVVDEPGDYVIRQVGDKEHNFDVNFAFTVSPDKVVVDKNGTPIAMPITIGSIKPNMSGTLVDQNDQPFTGEHVNLQFKEVQSDGSDFSNYKTYPWLYERWIDVDITGHFEGNVPDGYYQAIGVGTNTAFVKFASPIELVLDQDNSVKPPFYTFQGKANLYDGSAIKHGNVSITNMEENVWKGMAINNGYFGSNMTPGNTFKIKHINFELGETWYEFNLNKTITADSSNSNIDITIEPNVMGVLAGIDELNGTEWANVRIRPVYTESDLSQLDYQEYQLNPWEFDIWAKVITLNSQHVFYTQLPGGNYVLEEVQVDKNNVRLSIPFSLGPNSDGIVTENNGKYVINVNYNANVTGTISENSQPLADAWVNITKIDPNNTNMPTEWFGTKTNDQGAFKFSLKAGQYKLEGYNKEGYFDQSQQWHDGVWTNVGYKFTLATDQDTATITIEPNLSGSIVLADSTPLNNSWVDIREIKDDGQGNDMIDWNSGYWFNTPQDSNTFQGSLPNGRYVVTGFGGKNVWYGMDNLNITFTIADDKQVIQVKPLEQNFKGKAYFSPDGTGAVSWGWIRLRLESASFDDWHKKRNLNTEDDGSFSASLPDGNYIIEEFGNGKDFRRINQLITVSGTTITGLSGTVGSYVIKPPAPNVSGVVMNKNGTQYTGKAWVQIRPANADEYDWSKVVSVEYRNFNGTYKFETALPSGNYVLFSVDSFDFHYRTNIALTIPGSNTGLEVVPPIPNLTGVVYQGTSSASDLMTKGWLNIERVDANGNQVKLDGTAIPQNEVNDAYEGIVWQYTIGTEINSLGQFEMFIENGVNYKIVSAGNNSTWYLAEQSFTGGIDSTGLNIVKPGDNVTITFTHVPDFLKGNNIAWISLFDANKMFYDPKFVQSSEYAFTARLKAGEYTIGSIDTTTGHFELEKTIQITSGINAITVDFNDYASTLLVSGTLTINGQPVTDSVSFAVSGTVDNTAKKVKITTDASGQFSVILPFNTTWRIDEMADSNGYRTLTGQTGFSTVESNITNQAINITY